MPARQAFLTFDVCCRSQTYVIIKSGGREARILRQVYSFKTIDFLQEILSPYVMQIRQLQPRHFTCRRSWDHSDGIRSAT